MKYSIRLVACIHCISLVLPFVVGAEESFRYVPQPEQGERLPDGVKGEIQVKRITIQKGDTLFDLSKKYGGKGFYYPQILLFNNIRNPNLIYEGKGLTVPVTSAEKIESGAISKPAPAVERKKRKTKISVRKKDKSEKHETAVSAGSTGGEPSNAAKQSLDSANTAFDSLPAGSAESEQILYKKGITSYRKGEYALAIESFNVFLSRYPGSPVAPDVALYRAESYLKLAGQ